MHANFNLATVYGLAQAPGEVTGGGGNVEQTTTAAQGQAKGGPQGPIGQCGGGDPMLTIGMMLAMFAAFYLLLIRPQQKKAKTHQKMLDDLKKGDEVITGGGLVGKISGVSEKFFTVEISEKVRVRVLKSQVVDKYKE